MMNQKTTRATSIGQIASQVLRRNLSGLVTGRSSRGVYLQPEGDLTLYLTDDHFRGPLTINLRGAREALLSVQTGDLAEFEGAQINFTDSKLSVQTESPLIWKPGQPPSTQQTSALDLNQVISQVLGSQPDHPYLPLLETLSSGEARPLQGLAGFTDQVIQLSISLGSCNPSQILSALDPLLGTGPGLTPLGDDLILGTLLAVYRTQKSLNWTGDLIHFYHTVISAAEEKTTRVSWSLLSCAVLGSADERIIRVLDGLIAGREIPQVDLENLLGWGSSSGMAVLAGMMLVLG